MANLSRTQPYKKSSFGIKKSDSRTSDHIVGGELYSFFNVGGVEKNDRQRDGFVYEVHKDYQLIKPGDIIDIHRHVFVRKANTETFRYINKGDHEENYSPTQNKIFWTKGWIDDDSEEEQSSKFKDCSLPELMKERNGN